MQYEYNVLIVDDVLENIQVAMNILKEESYNFSYAKNGLDALSLLREGQFDLILLDIMMPGIDGYEVCKRIKSDPKLCDIPIIFLTAKADIDSMSKAFEVGGVDYITKPFHPEELLSRVKNHLELHQARQVLRQHNLSLKNKLKRERERIYTELEKSQKEMIFMLTELIESTSDETGRHIHRVSEYSRLLAHHHPSLSFEDEEVIYHASPMHDIGKLSVPSNILHKEGRLSEEEFEIMKTHTTHAHNYLKMLDRKVMKAADIIAYQHHEKFNGTGYPNALAGEDIHIYARIVALADVFDALTHKRVYKEAWSVDEAVEYIKGHSATQFDPQIVAIFEEHLSEFIAIAQS